MSLCCVVVSGHCEGYQQDGTHDVVKKVAEPVIEVAGHRDRQLWGVELPTEGECVVPIDEAVWE